jgi:hypothetical protein
MNTAQLTQMGKIVKAYLMNIKTLLGVMLLCYAFYTSSTSIPQKMSAFSAAKTENAKLVDDKKNLSFQEARLKAIGKELDKVKVTVYKLDKDASPNLAMVDLAQKVIGLAESTQNTYLELSPPKPTTLDVDKSVQLPVDLPNNLLGGSALTTAPPPSSPPTAPAGAPLTATPAGTPGTNAGALNAYEYTLSIQGTYASLAKFIHEISDAKGGLQGNQKDSPQGSQEDSPKESSDDKAKLPSLVIIKSATIEPASGDKKGVTPDTVKLELDFLIPFTQ